MLSFDMRYKEGKVYMEIKETRCIFKEDTHQYFLVDAAGEVVKELISVTTLLRKHNLAPDYSNVPSATLAAKAEYGKLVHKELEEYIKHGQIGFTQELQDFIGWAKENDFNAVDSEFIVHNDIVAGTVDLLGDQRLAIDDGRNILGDFKTTATLHKETVSWQLSLYAYLYKRQFGGVIDELKAFHFNDGLKVVDIQMQPLKEIERLLDCERKGEIYLSRQLAVEDGLMAELVEAEQVIKQIELQKKEAEEKAVQLRQTLLDKMKEQNIKSFENDLIKITYIEPTTRETIDSAKLKKELPEIAEQYKKISNVKDGVRITLKGV